MTITLADDNKPAKGSVRQRFSLNVPTDEQLAAGQWKTLPCGLDVLLAPTNTQEFRKAAATAIRRFGGPKARTVEDLPPEKQGEWFMDVLARAVFKGFRDPLTKEGEIVLDGPAKEAALKAFGSAELSDSLQSRIWILANLPTVRQELDDVIGVVSIDYELETENAGKN